MKICFGWSRVVLNLSTRWAFRHGCDLLDGRCFTPAPAMAQARPQARPAVINSYNGSGLTLRAYIQRPLKTKTSWRTASRTHRTGISGTR